LFIARLPRRFHQGGHDLAAPGGQARDDAPAKGRSARGGGGGGPAAEEE